MAGVDLRTVADLMGHANIQMTMRYAHLAQAHKADALKKLSAFNAAQRKRQEAVILFPAGQEKATGTTTDTEAKSSLAVAAGGSK
jgi:site-specific recombinase XerD